MDLSHVLSCTQKEMVTTLPDHKQRADNERETETLGIWSRHMDVSVNGEQTDHNSAAFGRRLGNSWNTIITSCFHLQLLMAERLRM